MIMRCNAQQYPQYIGDLPFCPWALFLRARVCVLVSCIQYIFDRGPCSHNDGSQARSLVAQVSYHISCNLLCLGIWIMTTRMDRSLVLLGCRISDVAPPSENYGTAIPICMTSALSMPCHPCVTPKLICGIAKGTWAV